VSQVPGDSARIIGTFLPSKNGQPTLGLAVFFGTAQGFL
jgi:hypothetical protein